MMESKMMWLLPLLLLGAVMPACQAEDVDFTGKINAALQAALLLVDDFMVLPSLALTLNVPNIANVAIQLTNSNITNFKEIYADNCIHHDNGIVEMSLQLPALDILTEAYTMKGTVLENIPIDGAGSASFLLKNLRMTVKGNTTDFNNPAGKPTMVFTDATLELDLERWAVDMENLTPGSDLGTLMNSFFSMIGEDIFILLANTLNETDIILNLLNSVFSANDETVTREVIEGRLTELLTKALSIPHKTT